MGSLSAGISAHDKLMYSISVDQTKRGRYQGRRRMREGEEEKQEEKEDRSRGREVGGEG